MRIVIEMKRDASPDVLLNQLYRFTPLQTSFGVNMPEKDRPKIRVIDPAGKWFKAEIVRAQAAAGANFTVCDINVPVEVK